MGEIVFKEESYAIMGVCMDVHRELGSGYLEIVYKDAIEIEFIRLGIPYEREKEFQVIYKGTPLKRTFNVDFYVYDKINLEIKAKSGLVDEFVRQIINYNSCSNSKLGLLVNFGKPSLESKRIVS
jgi:GxxExxY protein